jgi:cyclase
VIPVRGGVYMLSAGGGNLAVFIGADGTVVVDADTGDRNDEILGTILALPTGEGVGTGPEGVTAENPTSGVGSPGSIDPALRFLVNTHWHFDHTGGNEGFARAGATIIAHEGVAALLAENQVMAALGGREVPAAPPPARPEITFSERLNLAWNGDLLHVVHMPGAHSNGDAIVHFRDANVVHMGDLFFNGSYPFIDVDFGGNLSGMVDAVQEVLDHTDEATLFIPGHGPLAYRMDLEAYGEMLRTVRDRVQRLIDLGRTREEVQAAKPTADLDVVWGGMGGFTDPDFWVGLVYDGMVKARSGG